jgi:hypothetical protein
MMTLFSPSPSILPGRLSPVSMWQVLLSETPFVFCSNCAEKIISSSVTIDFVCGCAQSSVKLGLLIPAEVTKHPFNLLASFS